MLLLVLGLAALGLFGFGGFVLYMLISMIRDLYRESRGLY